MIEVHTGSKPGRPKLALIVVVTAFVATLLLALWQVGHKRALLEPIAIKGTPLTVQLPRGWVADLETPGQYYLPASDSLQQLGVGVMKSLRIEYERGGRFSPPEWSRGAAAARIGEWPAIQAPASEHDARLEGGGGVVRFRSYMRVAVTPRGDVIRMLYFVLNAVQTPTARMAIPVSRADLEPFEAIAASVKLTAEGASATAGEAQQRVGATFEGDPQWRWSLPVFDDVAGCHLGPGVGSPPTWGVSVFRTWLAQGRDVDALLRDAVHEGGAVAPGAVELSDVRREDGLQIRQARLMQNGRMNFAALIAAAPGDALLLTGAASTADGVERMTRAVQQIIATLHFASTEQTLDVAAAEEAGRTVAQRIAMHGMFTWWGEDASQLFYAADNDNFGASVLYWRPAAGDPSAGYVGGELVDSPVVRYLMSWRVDGSAAGFEWTFDVAPKVPASSVREHVVRETRSGAGAPIERRVSSDDGVMRQSFEPGPNYVCWPAICGAEYLVAKGDPSDAVIQTTCPWEVGIGVRRLRRLPPDENGRARVLVQDDYDPCGSIIVYETGARQFSAVEPGFVIRQTSREQVERTHPDLPRLYEKLIRSGGE